MKIDGLSSNNYITSRIRENIKKLKNQSEQMKNFMPLFLSLIVNAHSYGQAVLEQTHTPGGSLSLVEFRSSVGWYYSLIHPNGTAKAYNTSHEEIASITPPDYQGWLKDIRYISPDIFDVDPSNWEALISYQNTTTQARRIAIVRNGATVQVIGDYPFVVNPWIFQIDGMYKLSVVVYSSVSATIERTEIYSLPGTSETTGFDETDSRTNSMQWPYPNPTLERVFVPCSLGDEVELWSPLGVMLTKTVSEGDQAVLEVQGFSSGQYVIRSNGVYVGSVIIR